MVKEINIKLSREEILVLDFLPSILDKHARQYTLGDISRMLTEENIDNPQKIIESLVSRKLITRSLGNDGTWVKTLDGVHVLLASEFSGDK